MTSQEYTVDGYEVRRVKDIMSIDADGISINNLVHLLRFSPAFTKIVYIDQNDTQIYVSNMKLHRDGYAAIIYHDSDGDNEEWYLNGKRHRVDEPAVIKSNGDRTWYLNGKCHRVGQPAVIKSNGDQEWYFNHKRHRVGGPAVITANGDQEWYLNDVHHRVDGPSIIYPDGNQEWYLNGDHHRVDGPAMTYSNGDELWYLNGVYHREGGPAVKILIKEIGISGEYIKEGDDFWNSETMEPGYGYQYWHEGKLINHRKEDFEVNLTNLVYPSMNIKG